MVKRYRPNWNAGTNSYGVHDAVDGEFVRHSDYAALEAQLAEAKGKLNEIACWSQSLGLLWWQVKAREGISALEATPPAPKVTEVRPLDDWHEDYGDVVWWARLEGEWIGEAAWIGTPNDSDWPGYHTHWSAHPPFPAALTAAQEAGKP